MGSEGQYTLPRRCNRASNFFRLILLISALSSPTWSGAQCTADAGTYISGLLTDNLCNHSNQLIQDCAGTPFAPNSPQAIYQISLDSPSSAVIELSSSSGFTPYLSLFSAASGCSDSTSCGSYEAVGNYPGDIVTLPSTSELPAGQYYLLVGDLVDAAVTCPNAEAQYTLSLASGSFTPTLQSFVTISKALTGNSGPVPDLASAGGQLTYTITLTNSGSVDATNYALSDRIPANTRFISAASGGVLNGNTVSWVGLTINAGTSVSITVTLKVDDSLPRGLTQITNVAYPTGTASPSCPSADPACVVTPIETMATVSIVKTLTGNSNLIPGLASAGSQLTYTIALSNPGNIDAANYSISDALPENTTLVSASNDGTLSGRIVVWNGLTVPAGGDLIVTITLRVANSLPAGVSQIANVVYQTGSIPAPCPSTDPACFVILTPSLPPNEARAADLNATLSGPTSAAGGQYITYTLTLDNNGLDAADGASFVDDLPLGVSHISVSCILERGGASCPQSFGKIGNASNSKIRVAGAIPSFPALGEVVVQIRCQLPIEGDTSLTNVAAITPPAGVTDPDTDTNNTSISTAMSYLADIAVSVVHGPVIANSQIIYTIRYVNQGPAAADGEVPLKASVDFYGSAALGTLDSEFISCVASAGTVCPQDTSFGRYTGPVASLQLFSAVAPVWPAGGSLTISYAITRNVGLIPCDTPLGVAQFTSSALVSGVSGISDPNQSNNSAGIYITTPAGASCPRVALVASVSHNPRDFGLGTPITYTITYANDGPDAADGAVVFDHFSAGAHDDYFGIDSKFVDCSSSSGAMCPRGIPEEGGYQTFDGIVIPTFPSGSSIALTYETTFAAVIPLPCGTRAIDIANIARILPPGGVEDTFLQNVGSDRLSTPASQPCPAADLVTSMAQTSSDALPLTYEITFTNNGPVAADRAPIMHKLSSDVPNGRNYFGGVANFQFLSCKSTAGTSCPEDSDFGSGAVFEAAFPFQSTVASWPRGGSLTIAYQVTSIACGTPVGKLTSFASAGAPSGTPDPNSNNNFSEITLTTPAGPQCPQSDVATTLTNSGPISFTSPTTYTFTFINNGPSAADGGSIRAESLYTGSLSTLAETEYVSCTSSADMVCPPDSAFQNFAYGSGSLFGAKLTKWPVGGTLAVVYRATVRSSAETSCRAANNGLTYTALALQQPGAIDPQPNNNAARIIDGIACVDISVNKSVVPSVVGAGAAVIYTVDVANSGRGDANGVAFSDPLSAGFLYGSATCAAQVGSATCGAVKYDIATRTVSSIVTALPNAATVRFTIAGTADTTPGTYLNTAYANLPSDTYDPNLASNTSYVNLQISNTSSAITLVETVVGAPPAGLPSPLTFKGHLTCGTQTPQAWSITVPAGSTTGSSAPLEAWDGDSCEVFQDPAPEPMAGYIWAGEPTITPNPIPKFRAGSQQTVAIANVLNYSDTPVLSIGKTASAASFEVGRTASYTLRLANTGVRTTSTSAIVTDAVPIGLIVGTLPTDCSATDQVVKCIVAPGVAPGDSASFLIPVTPSEVLAGMSITNTSQVSGGGDTSCPGNIHCSASVATAVHPASLPQLEIVKTASAANLVVGQTATYSLRVTNIGTSPTSTAATVLDSMPGSLALAELPEGCVAVGLQVRCTIPPGLAPSDSKTFVILVILSPVPNGTTVSNTASVSGGGDPSCPGASHCTSTVSVLSKFADTPQLSLVKTASAPNFVVGQRASYTLRVTNTSTAVTTESALIIDPIPPGLALDTLPTECVATGQQVACSIPSGLAPNAAMSFTISVVPTVSLVGVAFSNTATVTGGGDSSCPAAKHCTSSVGGLAAMPRLVIKDSATPSSFAVGQPATYTLQVANTSALATTEAARVTDAIPDGLALGALPSSCSAVDQVVSCSIPPGLALGDMVSFRIPVTPQPLAGSTILSNVVTLTGGGDQGCPLAQRCVDTLATPVNMPQLTITDVATPVNFSVGQLAQYTLQITNSGTSQTTVAATVTDTVSEGLFLGVLPSDCIAVGHAVSCAIAAGLTPGAIVSFAIPVTPDSTLGGSTITNTAFVSGGGDGRCLSSTVCSSSVTTLVFSESKPQLTIVLEASAERFVVGQPASYMFHVTNTGTSPTTFTATVSDLMPSDVTLGQLPSACSAANLQVRCIIPVGLSPNASADFVIAVTLSPVPPGTVLSDTVTVSGGGDAECPSAGRCTSNVTTQTALASFPQLTLSKTASAAAFIVGRDANYTLKITNTGTASTTAAAKVIDLLPEGLDLGPLPTACSSAGQQVTCSLPSNLSSGGVTSFVIPVVPTTSANEKTLNNSATIIGGGDDSCPSATHCVSTIDIPITAVPAPQLAICAKASPSNFAAGQPATYMLIVANRGTGSTNGTITVTDELPTSLSLQATAKFERTSTSTSTGIQIAVAGLPTGCTAANQFVTCTRAAPLIAGDTWSLAIPVVVKAGAEGAVTNIATVEGGGDSSCPAADRCTSSITNIVNSAALNAPQLMIRKTIDVSAFALGQSANYGLQIINTGTAATTAIAIVSDSIPVGLALGSLQSGCSAIGQQVSCTVSSGLSAGEARTFAIPVTLIAAADGTVVSNTASVVGGGDSTCPANARCTSSINTPVVSSQRPTPAPIDAYWLSWIVAFGVSALACIRVNSTRRRGVHNKE